MANVHSHYFVRNVDPEVPSRPMKQSLYLSRFPEDSQALKFENHCPRAPPTVVLCLCFLYVPLPDLPPRTISHFGTEWGVQCRCGMGAAGLH